jgi:hypothetical protein
MKDNKSKFKVVETAADGHRPQLCSSIMGTKSTIDGIGRTDFNYTNGLITKIKHRQGTQVSQTLEYSYTDQLIQLFLILCNKLYYNTDDTVSTKKGACFEGIKRQSFIMEHCILKIKFNKDERILDDAAPVFKIHSEF